MNLVSKSSFLFHSKNVMRLGVMLVICSLLVNMVAVPKAKAVAVVDDVAVGAAATAAYLTSTGIPLTVTAGGASASSAGIVAVAGEYAAATGAAASGEALLGTVAAGTAVSTAGAIVLTAAAAVAVGAFAYWLYETYLADADSCIVYDNSTLGDFGVSTFVPLGSFKYYTNSSSVQTGTLLSCDAPVFLKHVYWTYDGLPSNYLGYCAAYFYSDTPFSLEDGNTYNSVYNGNYYYFSFSGNKKSTTIPLDYFTYIGYFSSAQAGMDFLLGLSSTELTLGLTNVGYSPIPEIAPAKQLELDIAAPPELELADLPEFTMNKVAAGDWSQPSNVPYSVVDPDPVPDPDPDPADPGGSDPTVPEDTPDIDDLGLPSLGAALTTRFPFSIPWDIYRGLKLLSAPAEVPKFEVDFFAPLNNRVGGWKGDTKIVIDFGYYPEFSFIGELCRWTSTIGYCLFLASATKRFIWTA